MFLHKWNPQLEKYEPFESPAVNIMLYSKDMDVLCDCANCGKEGVFGECYTSRMIHTTAGFGYSVCGDCHHQECLLLTKYENYV